MRACGLTRLGARDVMAQAAVNELAVGVVEAALAAMLLRPVGKVENIAAKAAPTGTATADPLAVCVTAKMPSRDFAKILSGTPASITNIRNADQPFLDWSVEERMGQPHTIRPVRLFAAIAPMACAR